MTPIPSTLFSYNPMSRFMSADASDLHRFIGTSMKKILSIRSERTGSVEEFELRDVIRDLEGDVEYWVYHNEQINLRVRIYND